MNICVEGSVGELGRSQPTTGGIYRLINEVMDEQIREFRIKSVIALGDSGDPRAVSPLVDCCSDKDPEIRRYATEALYKLRSGRAVHALIGRMKDKDEEPGTRQRAAAALAAIRTYNAIEALKDRFSDADEDPFIRSYVARVMEQTRIW
jgi:HEAT repeat protein